MKKFTANNLIKKWILFLSLVTIIGCSGGEGARYVEDNGKKVIEETISNFKDGVVIGKELDSINGNYSVTIKKNRWRHGRSWEVDKIYVTEFEYKSVSLGDTIK